MKYAIITGGWSPEKTENINGAQDVYESLIKSHEVKKFIFDDTFNSEQNKEIISDIKNYNPDLVFLCTTEELPIQGILDFLGIKYTGSNVLATSLSLDKEKCKLLFKAHNIATTPGQAVSREMFTEGNLNYDSIVYPVVVKPNSSGSSCGISLAKNHQELVDGLKYAFTLDNKVLIEKFILGREITVPMLDGNKLPPIEIIKKREIFDFESKSDFKKFVKYERASIDEDVLLQIDLIMLKLRDIFGIRNIFRADFILTENNNLVLLEINTLPCLGDGMMGVSARANNWSYDDFLEKVSESALNN
jgi:D-alanine-D-alanine ligase